MSSDCMTVGLTPLDIKKYCEDNLLHILKKRKKHKVKINLDYSDGVINTLVDILEVYFCVNVNTIYNKAEKEVTK